MVRRFALALAACHNAVPEGAYVCRSAADCPDLWVCRADGYCWIHDLPDAGSDAPGCITEACNGRDDDCDGLVDEGVLGVGTAVSANPTPEYLGAVIAPVASGFALFGSGTGTGAGWSLVDPNGTANPIVASPEAFFFEAVSIGDRVLVSGGIGSADTPSVPQVGLHLFDLSAGTAPLSFFAIGDLTNDLRLSLIADFDGTSATVYETQTMGSDTALRRARVDMTTTSALSDVMIASDLASIFAVVHTTANDFVAYRDTAHDLHFSREQAGNGMSPSYPLGSIASMQGQLAGIQLGIRDSQRPVSTTNPILLVWGSENVVSFVEITDTSDSASFAVSSPRTLTGTRGPFADLITLHPIAIVPAPFESSISPPHWLVALVGNDGSTSSSPLSIVQVFEITETDVRELASPDEMYAQRGEVGLAVSNGHIRLAEAGNAGGLVTRSIGCE